MFGLFHGIGWLYSSLPSPHYFRRSKFLKWISLQTSEQPPPNSTKILKFNARNRKCNLSTISREIKKSTIIPNGILSLLLLMNRLEIGIRNYSATSIFYRIKTKNKSHQIVIECDFTIRVLRETYQNPQWGRKLQPPALEQRTSSTSPSPPFLSLYLYPCDSVGLLRHGLRPPFSEKL